MSIRVCFGMGYHHSSSEAELKFEFLIMDMEDVTDVEIERGAKLTGQQWIAKSSVPSYLLPEVSNSSRISP